jgi:hypothetical protein
MLFNQFVRPQANAESVQQSGRGEPPRPAGFIRLVDSSTRGAGKPPAAVPQADGAGHEE